MPATAVSDRSQCRVCSHSYVRQFNCEGYVYGVCGNCGSISKVLTETEYRRLDVTYDPGDLFEGLSVEALRQTMDIPEKKRVYGPIVERLRTLRNGGPVRLLDIGCGTGAILVAARELGCQVSGIEPSESHSRVGRDLFGLDIKTAYFSKDTEAANSYDIVVLSHVIEHIFNQRDFLNDVYTLLRPGGLIFVATPNAASTIARVTGRHWSMLRPVDHVGLLTGRAFSALAPHGSEFTIRTDEYSWEPCIAIAGSLRRALKSRNGSKNIAAGAAKEPSNSFNSTVAKIGSSSALRSAAVALSLPVYAYDKTFGQASCLVVEIRKPL